MVSEIRILSENKWDCSPQPLEGLAKNKIDLQSKKEKWKFFGFFFLVTLNSLWFGQFLNKYRTDGWIGDSTFQAVNAIIHT